MDKEFQEWFYLFTITGNFEGLYRYYFAAMGHLGPIFRQSGVGLLYSLGLAWAAFCFLKAPVDRLLTGLGVLVMTLIAGFLLSPTKNNSHLGEKEGYELSVGGYYAFVLAGTLTRVFDTDIVSSFKSTINNALGGQGTASDAIAIAYSNAAKEAGQKFAGAEGSEAFIDYNAVCGAQALATFTTKKDIEYLNAVGIGSNVLGLSKLDRTTASQTRTKLWENGIINTIQSDGYFTTLFNINPVTETAEIFSRDESRGLALLRKIPAENNTINGTKGYRIPTAEYYTNSLGGESDEKTEIEDSYEKLSDTSDELSEMHAPGAVDTPEDTPEDFVFYPKNCEDLYHVASLTMKNFREGVSDLPQYKDLKYAKADAAISSANEARLAVNDQMNAVLKELGHKHRVEASFWESMSDHIWAPLKTRS